jgi:abequosyltransferase
MNIKLSICIPTYNRANFLGAAIDSVIKQATEEVEIVISDNASTDHTEELVREYQTRFPRIRYHKAKENMGADRNFLKVAELATGEYCWLLGSDDALADGAISTVLPMLGVADVYLTDVRNMSFDMKNILQSHQSMLNTSSGKIYDCKNPDELLTYFKDACHLGSLFGFISAIIFKRNSWQAQPVIEELVGSNWIHVAKIFLMMREGAVIQYIGLPLVLNRAGNDSFLATVGYTRRRLIDLDYQRVARAVFPDKPALLTEVTRVVAENYFTLRVILSDKRASVAADGAIEARRLTNAYINIFHDTSNYRLKMLVLKICPLWLLSSLRRVIRKNKR